MISPAASRSVKQTIPKPFLRSWAKSPSGSWLSSTANRSPSANSVIAGSVACRGIQSLRRSLFYQLVQPLLAKLGGNTASAVPPRQRVRTASRLKKTPGRLDFQRGILQRSANGELEVTTTGHRGHIFSARLVWATALLCWSVNAAMLSRGMGRSRAV